MKRLLVAAFVVFIVGGTVVISGGVGSGAKIFFPKEERNPVTHLRWNEADEQFQFAIVSDRTGGHRAEIFSQAVEKINLMQPAFVLSVGDLIEGGKKPDDKLAAEWKEFDGFVNKLTMPFFYVPGNHDVATKESAKFWQDKLGRRYYHFVYRNALFLILNGDDPPGSTGLGKEQIAWAKKVLADNASVNWTIVALHHPLWNANNGAKNGWGEIEKSLNGRSYTVFCGHVHRYQQWVRQGMNYYQLATTGGSSKVRGIEFKEFDHFVWVTMKKDGPVLANILLDAVHNESLASVKTVEPGSTTAKRLVTHSLKGFVYYEGTPIPGAVVTFSSDKGPAKGITAQGNVEADGSFQLTTYKAFDGIPAGEYKIAVSLAANKGGPLPARYTTAAKSSLSATINPGMNQVVLELKK